MTDMQDHMTLMASVFLTHKEVKDYKQCLRKACIACRRFNEGKTERLQFLTVTRLVARF